MPAYLRAQLGAHRIWFDYSHSDEDFECAPAESAGNERVLPGHAYIAPGHSHLLLTRSGANYMTKIEQSEPVNRHRPSVDVLFRSAATTFGARVTGVILSGMLDDGAAGLWAIDRQGGRAVVQETTTASP